MKPTYDADGCLDSTSPPDSLKARVTKGVDRCFPDLGENERELMIDYWTAQGAYSFARKMWEK